MKTRIVSLLLLAVMLLTACGKINNTSSSSLSDVASTLSDVEEALADERSGVSLACSATDSFCPYTAETTLNRELGILMYDSLVVLDNEFSPVMSLAEEIKINKKTVTVTIKSAQFSDGSAVTADDVVYCAEKAMDSKTRYGYALEDVKSVSASGSRTVVFNLSKQDPYFKNCLNFPIYKKGTDENESSDKIEIPPIGSGRYIINKAKTKLKANEDFHGGKPTLSSISLINTPDDDALQHNLEVGNISYYYSDLSDCSIPGLRGKYESVILNNLVFLGVNMESGVMSGTEMRQAVSAAIDRNAITDNAYYRNAIPATGIFNPEWCEKDSIMQTTETVVNENVYLAQLAKIGYNEKDKNGYYVNSAGDRLSLKLVNYKENEWRTAAAKLIKSELKAAGIFVQIDNLSWKDYKFALQNRHFDLYIAEVTLGNNMDISQLVTMKGDSAYGVYYSSKKKSDNSESSVTSVESSSDTDSETSDKKQEEEEKDFAGDTAKAVEEFYDGEATLQQVVAAFSNELPLIPLCYRTGVVSYSTNLSGVSPSYGDVFGGIENVILGSK